MPEPDWEAIETIQRTADEVVRVAAVEIEKLGGPNAVSGYLNDTLHNLLGVAISEQGTDGACELMQAGLKTAKKFQHDVRAVCHQVRFLRD